VTVLHINRPSSTRFVARVRMRGYRKYQLVGKPTKSKATAIRRMAAEFAKGFYHRADVICTADYYDPHQVCELRNI
jgi:hypothetical protein